VSADSVVEVARGAWLTLALMMLFSRLAFQAAGPVRMRAFLDRWQSGSTRRAWGTVSIAFALVLAVLSVPSLGDLGTNDLVVLGSVLVVLLADGSLNVLPSGFETFKSRLQERWVARHRGTGRTGDRHLFATVNAFLAAASISVAAFVLAYREIVWETVIVAAVLAVVLTSVLIGASSRRAPPSGP
jgi:hypothetical protein